MTFTKRLSEGARNGDITVRLHFRDQPVHARLAAVSAESSQPRRSFSGGIPER